jgi:hypothetical protein
MGYMKEPISYKYGIYERIHDTMILILAQNNIINALEP